MTKKISNFLKSKIVIHAGVILLTIIGFYFRVQSRAHLGMWVDELYVVNALSHCESLMDLIRNLPHLEFSSYLSGDYYLIFPFFKMFGDNKWGWPCLTSFQQFSVFISYSKFAHCM